jgi:adenine-specific DNA-methyltransferase
VRTDCYLYSQLIPYIGNKRKLLPLIAEAIAKTGVRGGLFVDLFSGGGVVSRLAKQIGFAVVSNDWEPYAFEIANCYVGCNRRPEFAALGGANAIFEHLNQLAPVEGYVCRHLCPADDFAPDHARDRMFFTRRNGARIDAIREQIAQWDAAGLLDRLERSYLLGPLLFGVSYVSNTSGVFKGFHRGWGGATHTALYRILSDLKLVAPILLDNARDNTVWRLDAQEAAERLRSRDTLVDIAYLDPPYNQHPYGSNYHVLNTVALWDKPAVSPVITEGDKSAIRLDWRTERRSAYNYASRAADAYDQLVETLPARTVLTSYSTDGNIPLDELIERSSRHGRLSCVMNAYKRYRVSAQRMSAKPVNVEFVLIIDKCARPNARAGEMVRDAILRREDNALRAHPESAARGLEIGFE